MLNYTDEIRGNEEKARLSYRPVEDGKYFENITATISIYTPSGYLTDVSASSMTWNSDNNTLYYEVDTRTEQFGNGRDYRAELIITDSDEVYLREFYFDVVKNPWQVNTTIEELVKLAPHASYESSGNFAEYASASKEAEDQLRILLRTSGYSPGEVTQKATLDCCHRYLSLSLLYLQNAGNGDKIMLKKHDQWQSMYENTLKHLLSRIKLDLDQNGTVDSKGEDIYSRRFEP